MDSFYTIVIAIAVIFLIIVLIIMGLMLQRQDSDKVYPSYATTCPDGWAIDMNGNCKIPAAGSPNAPDSSKINDFIGANKQTIQPIAGYLKFNDISICEKKSWANAVGVSWDGVTNYNKCD